MPTAQSLLDSVREECTDYAASPYPPPRREASDGAA